MKPFHSIAIPHRDILEGRLTLDVFAAQLWDVKQGRGSDEYKDAETFFERTYMTRGLENLLSVVEKRLKGEGGDPVIQLQTPFGGGKTHALIALYHKAKEWKANTVVFVGTVPDVQTTTIWGSMEEQLTGNVSKFSGQISPGSDKLKELLSQYEPVLILFDEVLEYVSRAAGVKVGDNTLATQTIAFMQELTEAVKGLDRVSVVIALPSSELEHFDESAHRLFAMLKKVAGRMEKIYTPVEDDEISKIVKRRLFSYIDEESAKDVVKKFVNYANKEELLPQGIEPSQYRDKFLDSFPFMPEVIEVLYHRWGSFPEFQRTRGVLRLLAFVVNDLKEANIPYISLADFNLEREDIRQELVKYIGSEYNSIIAADITNAKNIELGKSYRGYKVGTRVATTIFMYSFSGGIERGATLNEIKRSAATPNIPSSVIAEAVEELRRKLFYLQTVSDKYFFSNQPNLNRLLLIKMENITESELKEAYLELLKANLEGKKLKVYPWVENPSQIPDTEELKLVILEKEDETVMNKILETKGHAPRVYRNTVFFLLPHESERVGFINSLKRKLAYEHIKQDEAVNLSESQRKEIDEELKRANETLQESIRRFYRIIAIPDKQKFKFIDLGLPTFGEDSKLDQKVYEKLRSENEILEKIAPLAIKTKYLNEREYVSTEQLYQSLLKTPGEIRLINKQGLETGIAEGVANGFFGLGELQGERPICRYFKNQASVSFSESEVIIREDLCKEEILKEEGVPIEVEPAEAKSPISLCEEKAHTELQLRFQVPPGKGSEIGRVMNFLRSKFEIVEIRLVAQNGQISQREFEEKILEAFEQIKVKPELD